MSESFDKKRVIKNSGLLYVRMLFTMWLNLWATRLVLANLGVKDLGVYGVVGSIVSMFTVLTGGVTSAVQRFITYEMGRNNGNVGSVFCTSLNVIFILSAIMFVLLETIGMWFLNNKIEIPLQSMPAAQWVFQLSILTCIFNVISIPYNSLIIAHERMNAFAAISILQVVMSCMAAYSLAYLSNRLFLYAVMMAIIGVFIRLVYQWYCVCHFPESKYHLIIDKDKLRQMIGFAGVSTFSGILNIIASQGIVLIINWTFGVALNAVYNIAMQLKNSILSFGLNLQRAISPQIIKTFASGEIDSHKKLVYSGSKMMVYMIFLIMIPFLFRTEYIMHLWLGDVPAHAVVFARCTVFISLIYAAFEPIRTAVYATSRITRFTLIPDTLFLLVIPISYLVGRLTGSHSLFAATLVVVEFLSCLLRVYYAVRVSPLTVRELLSRILKPVVFVAAISVVVCWGLSVFTHRTLTGLICLLAIHSVILCIIVYMVGITMTERKQINNIISTMKNKIITPSGGDCPKTIAT